MNAPRIVFGVTAPVTARTFLLGQLGHFADQGWDVHLLSGASEDLAEFARHEHAALHVVPMDRDPRPADLLVIARLRRQFRALAPQVAVLGTPKMGVFGSIAAWLARVPRRVYLVHGLRSEGLVGAKRRILVALEKVACLCATDVVAVSPSLRDRLILEGITAADKVTVLGHGTANGVDTSRFTPSTPGEVATARSTLGLSADREAVAVVGRVTADKGLHHLPDLWRTILASRPATQLLLAGGAELATDADHRALAELEALPGVVVAGHVDQIEMVYRAADLLVMTSRREGLGMVILEAAACGTPAVAWRATGVVDAIIDEQTGSLVDAGDTRALAAQVIRLLGDRQLRERWGTAARNHVVTHFERDAVWRRWSDFLATAPIRRPTIGKTL